MVARTSLWIALACAVGGSATAAPNDRNDKKDRKDRKDKFVHKAASSPAVNLTDRAKPQAKKDETEPAAPTVRGEDALRIEGLLGEIHSKQLALLEKLVKETPDREVDEKARLSFQLGETYAKIHRFHRLSAVENDLKKNKAAADEHRAKARDALKGTIETLKAMTENASFVNYPKMDVALFYYAYTLSSAGYMTPARDAYDKLLKNYPKSKYVAEAHLAFAEAHFEANEWSLAESRYRQVLRLPKGAVTWYASYKLAWTALNLKKPQDALELFYQVTQGTKADPDRQQLYKAARKDFVRAYAAVGRADKALPAFQRVDAGGAYEMLGILADFYIDQGKSPQAITILRQLMTDKPASPAVCAWQHAIARAMLSVPGASPADKVTEIEQLVRLHGALSAKKALPPEAATECHDAAAEMSGQYARAYHQEAVKTKNLEITAHANRLYQAYLRQFTSAPDYGETAFFHAELAWVTAEWQKDPRLATLHWEEAAKAFGFALDTKKLGKPRTKEAADAAMIALMKARDVDPTVKPVEIKETAYEKMPVPRAIPEIDQKLIAAFEVYLANVTDPDDSERVDVMFMRANVFRRYEHYEKAIALYQEIVARHADHEAAEPSAQLALDSLNHLQRHKDMLAYARSLPKAFVARHARLADLTKKLYRTGSRKEAEELEAEGKRTGKLDRHVACALKYYEVYNADPLASDGDELLYNAGVCFEQGRSLTAAKEAYEMLQKYFPRSPNTAKAIARLGNTYGSIAFYKEASERLEEYAQKYAAEENAYLALSDAVMYRKGIGDDAAALRNATWFIEKWGRDKPDKAANVHYAMIAILEKKGDPDALVRHLREYIARFGKIGGPERLLAAQTRLGTTLWSASCPVATVDNTCMRMSRAPAIAAARTAVAGALPRRCGEEDKAEYAMVPRDARRAAEAMAAFASAVATYEANTGAFAIDPRGALYHYATARFTRLEHDYEAYLASPIPSGLDFDSRKPAIAAKSVERFKAWVVKKTADGKTLGGKYNDIVALKDGAVGIASAARLGSILQNFSTQLFRAEIPLQVRTGPFAEEAANSYCDQLATDAAPIEAASVTMYKKCLDTSTRLGWFSDWSRICERELGQIDPTNFPRTPELRDAPDNAASITDVAGPV